MSDCNAVCDPLIADMSEQIKKLTQENERLRLLLIEACGYISATDKDGEYYEYFRKRALEKKIV